jgi:hypothetical protein
VSVIASCSLAAEKAKGASPAKYPCSSRCVTRSQGQCRLLYPSVSSAEFRLFVPVLLRPIPNILDLQMFSVICGVERVSFAPGRPSSNVSFLDFPCEAATIEKSRCIQPFPHSGSQMRQRRQVGGKFNGAVYIIGIAFGGQVSEAYTLENRGSDSRDVMTARAGDDRNA